MPLPTLTDMQKAPEVEWGPYYEKAQAETKLDHPRIYPRQLLKVLGPDIQKANRLSEKLCQWSAAAESITLHRSDIDPTAHRPYKGRATYAIFATIPTLPSKPPLATWKGAIQAKGIAHWGTIANALRSFLLI